MKMFKIAAVVFTCIAIALGIPSGHFKPVGFAIAKKPVIATESTGPFVLSHNKANVATIDYGFEVAGWPYIEVVSLTGPVQIEFRYTEQFDALSQVDADGEYYFANGLTNTFRVETFNITRPGHYQSPLIQGGQRWQLATLLTPGSITIQDIGFKASIDPKDTKLDDSPSTFSCSNGLYNEIWKLGARASTAACVDAYSQLHTQNITSEGLYSPGQKPGITALAYEFVNYSMIFETKIVKGGTGWAFSQSPIGDGFLFIVSTNVSDPKHAFVNQNTTVAPRNKLAVTYGRGPTSQGIIGDYKIPFEVQENTWYTMKTALSSSQYLSVTMEGYLLMNVSLTSLPPSLGILSNGLFHNPQGGPFGFGPYQDQIAYFRNATAFAENGTQLYHSNLKDDSVLAEYGVATNNLSACLDGAKRDRLVWEGDFYHTSRIVPASTGRWDLLAGTLKFFANYQNPFPGISQGFMDIAPPIGYPNAPQTENLSPLFLQAGSLGGGFFGGLVDYQLLGFEAYYAYYQRTGDIDFVATIWPAYKKQIAALIARIDPTTGLANISGFLGPAYGTAVCSLLASALKGAAQIATTFNDHDLATTYRASAELVSLGVNKHLWNETAGVYTLSNSSMGDWSTAGIALAITSGVANTSRIASSLAQLSRLRVFPGYKDNTQLALNETSNGVAAISPNTNGFLLESALLANETAPAKYMLDNLWGAAMVQNDRYSSGASWEYVGQDLTPGLGVFTSLSHPWGGAPTYILPQYIAGIRPIGAGYKTWLIIPAYKGFDLDFAQATIKTGYGPLSVHWTLRNNLLTVTVNAPTTTSGSIQLPAGKLIKATVNGKMISTTTQEIMLSGGKSTIEIPV